MVGPIIQHLSLRYAQIATVVCTLAQTANSTT
jgi:hypothetical protein